MDYLSFDEFEAIRRLDTCTVSNAIERFELRLRNEGFVSCGVAALFPHFPPMLGYAVTARIRTSGPPPVGHTYYDRTDWWKHVLEIPAPRIAVIQDVDDPPGLGAFIGEVHANILIALGCAGAVTNGAVRDVPAVEATGFHLFAGNVSVSHAYHHIIGYGGPVEIRGLKISPGDLIHGDRHGILTIPKQIAREIPATAAAMVEKERKVIGLCRSPEFSMEKLCEAVRELG